MFDSPSDDFSKKTLSSVPGTFGKLLYVAGLRQKNGEYFHWGMARKHGETNANAAIGQNHTSLFLAVLRMPIRSLWEEVRGLAQEQSTDAQEYVGRLTEKGELLVPNQLEGGTRRHFNSVLLALCSLAGERARKADRAS